MRTIFLFLIAAAIAIAADPPKTPPPLPGEKMIQAVSVRVARRGQFRVTTDEKPLDLRATLDDRGLQPLHDDRHHGLELVGHIDPKADRANGKLAIANRSLRRGHRAATAVRELARFLSLK